MKTRLLFFFSLIVALCGNGQNTAFLYQGQLIDSGQPANGNDYGMVFYLYDAATNGNLLGNEGVASVTVSNGLFTAPLDFGMQFNGSPRWLQITVQKGGGAFTTLTPREEIYAAPYATYAETAGSATVAQVATSATTIGTVASGNVAQLNIANTTVQATGTLVVTAGFITGANVVVEGSGYTTAPAVTINDTTGSNAIILAQVFGGAVTNLAVENAGSHYSTSATVTIAPPPTDAAQMFSAVNIFDNPANSFVGSLSGSFSSGGLTLTSNLNLPITTASAGVIYSGADTMLHAYGNANFFGGLSAGNFALTGGDNVGVGFNALHNQTTGDNNTAIGAGAMENNTNGYGNTAIGLNALNANTGGYQNTATGVGAVGKNTTGFGNTGNGWGTLDQNINGVDCCGKSAAAVVPGCGIAAAKVVQACAAFAATFVGGCGSLAAKYRRSLRRGSLTNC